MNKLRLLTIIFISLIVLLILTNPSHEKFVNFCNEVDSDDYRNTYQKRFDAFIFSGYLKKTQYGDDVDSTKYIGILFNFFQLKKPQKLIELTNEPYPVVDTTTNPLYDTPPLADTTKN
jgi:hypothetical protein